MRLAIIVNENRKENPQLDEALIEETAAKYRLNYTLFVTKPEEIETTVKKAIDQTYDAFLVCGGDGTARSAAQLLIDHQIPLAILPLGTFNYFAKELNFPNDIDALFKIIKNNKIKTVDVGDINGIIFLNHSSIGFYTRILRLRKKHSNVLGTSKLFKVLFAAANFFHELPIYQLKMKTDDKNITIETCLVFVGNNYHFTDLLNFGERDSLTKGQLAIYILKCKNRWEVLKCAFSILFKTFDKHKYLLQYNTTEFVVEAKSKQINVVIDGDLFKLETPLNYTILNRKLTVFAAND